MSDIDLKARDNITALAAAVIRDWTGATSVTVARNVLDAAAPLIEAAVREQIARDIKAESAKQKRWANEAAQARGGARSHHDDGYRMGLDAAARLVRGES